jgi:signal transduction histidine kinase
VQIRTRLTLQFSLLVGSIVLVTFLAIFLLTIEFSERDFTRRLREKAITAAVLLIKVQEIDTTLLQVIDRAKRDNLYRENVRIYNSEDKQIYFSGDTARLTIQPEILNTVRKQSDYRFELNGFKMMGVLFNDIEKDYVVVVGAIDIHGARRLSYLRTLLTASYLILMAIVALAGWVYSGRALKPLKRIMDEVQSISPKNLDQRLKESSYRDEMGNLIMIFNELLDRIAKAFQLQKMFVSNVSHELKNPLTNITSQLEVTLFKDRTKEEYRETIESVLEDIQGINQLSNSLLELARLTRDGDSFTMTRIRLDDIIWEVRDFVNSFDPAFRIDVNIFNLPEEEDKLYVDGNPYLLKTAFQNIIENACKFSPDKKAIVSLSQMDNELVITIADHGPGIDQKDLKHVFEPFFRTNASSKIRGYGIGLSLSQRIISIHKGTIELSSQPGQGTEVVVKLTIAKAF